MKRKKRQKIDEEIRGFTPSSNEIDNRSRLDMLESSSGVVTRGKDLGRRKKGRVESLPPNVTPDVPGHTTSNVLPLSSRRDKEHVHMAIARFLYDVGLPLDAANSPFFQPMINAVASNGTGLEATSYHELRGWVLKNSLDEVNGLVDRYKGAWGRIGCSVLADEWTTESGRTLLNIFLYCSEGAMFFRSFDVSDTVHSSGFLYELLKGVVEEIGASNVLQVITDGAEHYADAGKMLTDTFRTMFWTPCAARNLRKERDPGQMDPISTDSIDLTEDWVTEKMGYFGSGDADWVALHQPVANSMLLDSPSDEAENLVAGFNYWDRPNAV
ncbi:hypothetical protein IFM89_001498 [Coptis chinensis]|uniref:DUF659 domain-containing protein n=1 Tax=Coptis chinensis TaxID=261450 RepID=A0A835H8H6_9MAGN|nr:hypothetical protein IFM89_001498 [Coptis chinensis]